MTPSTGPPAHNTRAKAKLKHAPPEKGMQSAAKHKKPTPTVSGFRLGFAAFFENMTGGKSEKAETCTSRHKRRHLERRISKLENEVHQAMAAMNAETGKLLKYRQLLNHPKHKKGWRISSQMSLGD